MKQLNADPWFANACQMGAIQEPLGHDLPIPNAQGSNGRIGGCLVKALHGIRTEIGRANQGVHDRPRLDARIGRWSDIDEADGSTLVATDGGMARVGLS